MGWIPKFLGWPAATIAATIVVPLLLVLYFLKLRRREVDVASTLLWRKAIQDLQVNAPFQKLRRNLLLLLQMLALLALCLALARPVTFFTPGAGKNSVILIDRSASMNAHDGDGGKTTRLEEAKRRARDLVDSMQRGSTAMVIAFDEGAQILQPFTADAPALRDAIDRIQPTDRRSRLKLAYQLAEAQTAFDPAQLRATEAPPQIFVYSDGRVLDASDLRVKGEIRFECVGDAPLKSADGKSTHNSATPNIGIITLSARRNYERPTEVQVFARLGNFGPDPVTADVQLSVAPLEEGMLAKPDQFSARGVASVSLAPERWTEAERQQKASGGFLAKDSVEFVLDLTSAAVIKLEQKHTEGDQLTSDDSAQVVLPPPKALSVLLVTDGNYFMEKLLATMNLKEPKTITPLEYEQAIPNNYDVIIFDRAYAPKELPKAGNFIYFGAIAPGLKLKQATDKGKGVMIDETDVLDWKRDHPILKGASFAKLFVVEGMKLDVPPEDEVLIEGMKGPLLVLHREGRSTHLVCAFDMLESTLPRIVSFPIFMSQALQFLAVGQDLGVSQAYAPGDTPRLPRVNLNMIPNAASLKSLRLNGPGGSRDIPIPSSGDVALPALEKVGLYTTDPIVPGYERLAVNLLDANESNLIPLDHAPGGIGEPVLAAGKKSRMELWWWIVACVALPLLMVEWWVYTRRVHL